ncbi:HAD family hydrolase [Desulfovibrio aminophilus]|uniref:HAD family hydrolase n=1 Tax=Desulfovibrio aminophilus TaxID=81425 RepID=UPI00041621C9|nr:HAD hydrolase-like protein [Desulfovibrio aminophilus]
MIIVNDLMRPEVLAGIRGFIFDCDGVLIDSFAANVWYYNRFRAHFGLPPMSPEEERYTHTRNTFDSFRHILPPERYEEAMRMRETFDYRLVLPHVRREPGVRGLLLWLRSRGFRLAVNTSRADTMDHILSHADLTGFFRPVVTALTEPRPKPASDGVLRILSDWRCPREEVVFIGDSVVDERTARAAGVRFWSYGDERLDAEVMIPDFFTFLRNLRRAYAGGAGHAGLDS